MIEINFSSLSEDILIKRPSVTSTILSKRNNKKTYTSKSRDKDEVLILNQICINKWRQAELNGKIRYDGERVMYYAFD